MEPLSRDRSRLLLRALSRLPRAPCDCRGCPRVVPKGALAAEHVDGLSAAEKMLAGQVRVTSVAHRCESAFLKFKHWSGNLKKDLYVRNAGLDSTKRGRPIF